MNKHRSENPENLELNRETLQDLTEAEVDEVRGGAYPAAGEITPPWRNRAFTPPTLAERELNY